MNTDDLAPTVVAAASEPGHGLLGQPDTWGWVGELTAETLQVAGELSLELLTRGSDWVNRRVETVELIDESRVRQQVTIDFRLPEHLPGSFELGGKTHHALPLLFLPRRSDLAYFDVRDETGQAVPMLTRKENARLTGLMLITAARRALSGDGNNRAPSEQLQTYLAAIPTKTLKSAGPLVYDIVTADPLLFEDPEAAKTLLADDAFRDLLGVCQYSSAVHVPLVVEPGQRRIVKVAWEGRWGTPPAQTGTDTTKRSTRYRRRWRNFQSFAGWRAQLRVLDTPQIGGSESHHIQVSVPAGVELTEAGCRNSPPRLMLPSGSDKPDPPKPDGDPSQPFTSAISPRAHLYIPRAHEHRAGLLQVGLRAARHGLLWAALVTGVLVTLLLTLYTLKADEIVGQSETGAAVLLLVPAVLAGFLVRPGEHAMARTLLRGPRLITTGLGVLPLIAAATLVSTSTTRGDELLTRVFGNPESQAPSSLTDLWAILAALAFVLTVCLGASVVLPRRGIRDPQAAHLASTPAVASDDDRQNQD